MMKGNKHIANQNMQEAYMKIKDNDIEERFFDNSGCSLHSINCLLKSLKELKAIECNYTILKKEDGFYLSKNGKFKTTKQSIFDLCDIISSGKEYNKRILDGINPQYVNLIVKEYSKKKNVPIYFKAGDIRCGHKKSAKELITEACNQLISNKTYSKDILYGLDTNYIRIVLSQYSAQKGVYFGFINGEIVLKKDKIEKEIDELEKKLNELKKKRDGK